MLRYECPSPEEDIAVLMTLEGQTQADQVNALVLHIAAEDAEVVAIVQEVVGQGPRPQIGAYSRKCSGGFPVLSPIASSRS